jgi:hypothetical protein
MEYELSEYMNDFPGRPNSSLQRKGERKKERKKNRYTKEEVQ